MPEKLNTNDENSGRDDIAVILIAAGQSKRLGQMKQCVMVNEQSLLERQARLALTLTSQVVVVVGYNAERCIEKIAHLPLKIISNPHWQEGMSTSIAEGVKSLSENYRAALVLLVDQWQLTPQHLLAQFECWQTEQSAIVVAHQLSEQRFGPPVIFPAKYFKPMSLLTGDDGAKSVIRHNMANVKFHTLPQAFVDLDSASQLAVFNQYATALYDPHF